MIPSRPKKGPVFVVLANCPIRIVHEGATRDECERWAKRKALLYATMGSSLAVIKDEPLVRRGPAGRPRAGGRK